MILATPTVTCEAGDEIVQVIAIVRLVMNVICIAVPIVMIVLGSIDLFKAVTSSKDEEIKKKQQTLIKRIIAGVIVFLVPTIVSLLMNLMGANNTWAECWNLAGEEDFSSLFSGEVSTGD